jgi:hypothetical protein
MTLCVLHVLCDLSFLRLTKQCRLQWQNWEFFRTSKTSSFREWSGWSKVFEFVAGLSGNTG